MLETNASFSKERLLYKSTPRFLADDDQFLVQELIPLVFFRI